MSDGSSGPAWGRVDQSVMRDPALSIEAKGIFAYLCSFADEEGKCYPGIETILSEIGMSKTRYYKYLAELKKCNLIRVEAGQRRQGSFPRNTYYINQSFPQFKETALNAEVSYLVFLLLHELSHLTTGEAEHTLLFHAMLDQYIAATNDFSGLHIVNDYCD